MAANSTTLFAEAELDKMGARTVPGWPEFRLTPTGRAFKLLKVSPHLHECLGCQADELWQERNVHGSNYPQLSLDGRQKGIHILMLETFVGPRSTGMQACHNDGNRNNWKLTNLRWDTPRGNARDRIFHGTDRSVTNQKMLIDVQIAQAAYEDLLKVAQLCGYGNLCGCFEELVTQFLLHLANCSLTPREAVHRHYRSDGIIAKSFYISRDIGIRFQDLGDAQGLTNSDLAEIQIGWIAYISAEG